MTVYAGYWLYNQAESDLEKVVAFPAAIAVSGSPYHTIGKVATHLDDINYWTHAARVNQSHHAYMARRGMQISASGARSLAYTSGKFVPMARPGSFPVRILRGRGARIAARVAGRMVPGLGWALLAYDLYTVGQAVLD